MNRALKLTLFGLLLVILTLALGLYQLPTTAATAADLSTIQSPFIAGIPVVVMPPVDNDALLLEDALRAGPGVPWRFALPLPVQITPDTDGVWESRADGTAVWRVAIHSPGAVSLNLGFGRYQMPDGGRLLLYTPDYKTVRGPFTEQDNETHGQLWTPLLSGEIVVIEVTVPAASVPFLELELTSVNHGYREFGTSPLSGSCNVDVVCPEGDPWRDEIRSVGVISTGGSTFCTGFLVNNTAEDLTPYFMTANHCGINAGNAPSLVVYWNYENSTCRPPGSPQSGGPGDGTLDQFQTGSFYRASYSPSDFTLVELDDAPNPAFNVHWAGWDANSGNFLGATAIHHPNTDEKRISFEYDPTMTTSYLGNSEPGDGTHVRVVDWDLGTTEPGSSGSPLFNPDHRIVGQLHGGYAACGNNSSDWYGRVSVSWNGGGSTTNRLRDWLDPLNTGNLTLDGRDLVEAPDFELTVTPPDVAICAGSNAVYTVDAGQVNGFVDPVTLNVTGQPAGTTATFAPNPITPPASSTLTIGATGGAAAGDYTLSITGVAPTMTHVITAGLNLSTAAPGRPTLVSPANGAINQPIRPNFTWTAASQAATYDIEIASDPGFTTIVDSATGLANTSYTASVDLTNNTTYYWRVRASNGCGLGNYSLVFSFVTEPLPGQCPAGFTPTILYTDDFESGAAGWTHSGQGDTWALSTQRQYSGVYSYKAIDPASVSDQRLVSPAVSLPTNEGPLSLSFWNYQRLEDASGGCYDGAILEISTDNGATWTQLESELLTDPYDGLVDSGYNNPLAGLSAWCGNPQDWLESIVDLDAYAGQSVQFRFRLGSDSSIGREGWYVDDVAVQSCQAAGTMVSQRIQMGWEVFQPNQLAARIRIVDPDQLIALPGATVNVTFTLPDGDTTTSAVTNSSGWATFLTPTVGGGSCTITVNSVTLAGYVLDTENSILTRTIACP